MQAKCKLSEKIDFLIEPPIAIVDDKLFDYFIFKLDIKFKQNPSKQPSSAHHD